MMPALRGDANFYPGASKAPGRARTIETQQQRRERLALLTIRSILGNPGCTLDLRSRDDLAMVARAAYVLADELMIAGGRA